MNQIYTAVVGVHGTIAHPGGYSFTITYRPHWEDGVCTPFRYIRMAIFDNTKTPAFTLPRSHLSVYGLAYEIAFSFKRTPCYKIIGPMTKTGYAIV